MEILFAIIIFLIFAKLIIAVTSFTLKIILFFIGILIILPILPILLLPAIIGGFILIGVLKLIF